MLNQFSLGNLSVCLLRLIGWFYARLEEKLGQASGAGDEAAGDGDGKGKDGAENEFVRASKEKFSGAQKALDDNSVFAKLR